MERSERRHAILAGACVFMAALVLRVALVETTRFTGDEARDYAIGMQLARGGQAPLLGPEVSSGAARLPGPLQYWLAGFPQLFTRAPEAGNLFFELMGAGAVWLFWLTLRGPFGEAGALFAAALMALSPWSALFGDRVWNPNAFLFFEGLALLAAVKMRERPHSAWVVLLVVASLALPQLHSSAPVVWLALIPLVAAPLRRAPRRALALGCVLGALLYLPLAIHEVRTGFGNSRAFVTEALGLARKTGQSSRLGLVLAPIYALRFLTLDVTYHELSGYWGGLDEAAAWHALWSGSEARPFHPLRLAALLASLALVVLSASLVVRGAGQPGAGGRRRPVLGAFAAAALVAVVSDALLLGLTRKRIFAHYVTPALPFVFVLFAAAAQRALANRRVFAWMVALAVAFGAGGIEATLSISRRIDGRNGLAVHRAVAERLLRDCAAAGRTPAACPARLDFGYVGLLYSHAIFAREALGLPLRWERGPADFAYRLQKRADPPPSQAARFPVTLVGPVGIYRLR
jgi:hypothetical protein